MRAALLLVVLASACESVGDVVARHRSGVEHTLSSLKTLDLSSVGPCEADHVPPEAAQVRLEGAASNGLLAYAQDLTSLSAPSQVAMRTVDSVEVLHCAALLDRGALAEGSLERLSPSRAEHSLTACERATWALVIRERDFVAPRLELATKRFAPGHWVADVLLFELKTGAWRGCYSVDAKSDPRIDLSDDETDHQPRLLANLSAAVSLALRKRTTSVLPLAFSP